MNQEAEKNRPSFDAIVEELKTNEEYITELVDQSEYLEYFEQIDNYKSTFDLSNQTVHYKNFIKGFQEDSSTIVNWT